MLETSKRPGVALTSSVANFTCLVRNIMYIALAFFSKLSLRRETVILMYHSVDSTNDFFAVNPKEFRRQIKYLKQNYAIISLDEIIDFIKERRNLPRKSVAITFDDGYHNFYLNVYPHLREDKLPATIFVTTGYVGKKWPLSSFKPKMLTWREIEKMSEDNIEIGAHTVTHPNLQEVSINEAENEILRSKEEIEKHTKKDASYFSYPFGRYTPEIVDIVKSLGFKGGLGGKGTIQKGENAFILSRIQVDGSVSFMLFKARLTRAVDWLEKLEQITKKILEKSPACVSYSPSGSQ